MSFQFVLAPIFLLGFALSEASLSIGLIAVFLLVHVGLENGGCWGGDGGYGDLLFASAVAVEGVAVGESVDRDVARGFALRN